MKVSREIIIKAIEELASQWGGDANTGETLRPQLESRLGCKITHGQVQDALIQRAYNAMAEIDRKRREAKS